MCFLLNSTRALTPSEGTTRARARFGSFVGGGRPLRAVDSGADRRNDDDDGVD